MRRLRAIFFLTFAFGCMRVVVPGKADELKHPIELGKECKDFFEVYIGAMEIVPQWRSQFRYIDSFKFEYLTATEHRF